MVVAVLSAYYVDSFDDSSVGTGRANIIEYIRQVKNAPAGTSLIDVSIGQVITGTWNL
jgi:hypothetical protein